MPMINFAMNRSCLLIPNITYLVKNFCFKLSTEIAASLSVSILNKEYLIMANNEVAELLKAICDKLASPEEFQKKLLTYLVGEFDKVKLQASTS